MHEILNQYNTAITLGFSAIVTLATVVYAVLTWKIVSETQKIRKAQSEPRVSVYLQRNENAMGYIDLVIQNVGMGPAYSVELKLEPDFVCRKGVNLSELGVFNHVIPYLAPNQKEQFFLTSLHEDYEKKIESRFEVKASYRDACRGTHVENSLIEFSYLKEMMQLGRPPLQKMADETEKIRKVFDSAISSRKLEVRIYTEKNIREENERIHNELQSETPIL